MCILEFQSKSYVLVPLQIVCRSKYIEDKNNNVNTLTVKQ